MRVAIVLPTIVKENEDDIRETSYLKLAGAVQRAGVDVTFFTLTKEKKPHVSYLNDVKVVFCPLSMIFPSLPKFLSATRFVWLTNLEGARFHYKSALSLFREIKKFKPDIIHLRGFFITNLFLLPLSRLCSIPTVIESVEVLFFGGVRKEITKICLKMATKVFASERGTIHKLINEYGIQSGRIVSVPCTGFDEKLFYPTDKESCKTKLGLDENYYYLLYVGSIYPKGFIKDPFELLHVLKELNEIERKHKLIVVGPGNKEDYIEYAKKLGVYSDVIMTGYVEPPKLNVYYNAADVFLWPYPQDTFGVGTALTEAIACGLPVISYSSKLAPEQDDCIKYVPHLDQKAMAEKAFEILKNYELRDKLVHNCLQRIKEHSFSRIAQKVKDEYEKILR